MTEKELSRYYWLKKEVEDIEKTLKQIEDKIKEFGYGVGASKIKEVVVNGTIQSSSIQEKYAELQEKLNQIQKLYIDRRLSVIEEYLKIENYINNITDDEMKIIVKMRNMDLLTWNDIADRMSEKTGKIISDYAIKKRYYRFFQKNNEMSHMSHSNMK